MPQLDTHPVPEPRIAGFLYVALHLPLVLPAFVLVGLAVAMARLLEPLGRA